MEYLRFQSKYLTKMNTTQHLHNHRQKNTNSAFSTRAPRAHKLHANTVQNASSAISSTDVAWPACFFYSHF